MPDVSPSSAEPDQPVPMVESEATENRPASTTIKAWPVYLLLIAVSAALLAGRILSLQPTLENRNSPFFSANDRSRWATVKALGDEGTYEIDDLVLMTEEVAGRKVRPWDSIDKVAHRGKDGQIHYYSSKPTLFPTLLAFKYRWLKAFTGKDLEHDRFAMAKMILILTNVLPFAIYLGLLAILVHRMSVADWAGWTVVAGAGMGTFLSTFAISINNHLPAAICVMVVVFCWLQLADRRAKGIGWFILAGLAAAFAVSNELPALSLLCLASLGFLWLNWKFFILGFLPAAGLIASAHFGTNWQAHESWRPAYAHRQDGPVFGKLDPKWDEMLDRQRLPDELRDELKSQGVELSPVWSLWEGEMKIPDGDRRWVLMDLSTKQRWALVLREGQEQIDLHQWDNWYEYPGSYWTRDVSQRSKVDQGEPSRARYLMHMTVGHHGIWSLTPMWLLSLLGAVIWLWRGKTSQRLLVIAFAMLFIVCLSFYTARPLIDRNYGGQTSGLRWMFWFTPFFLMTMLPAVDALRKSTAGKVTVIILVGLSVVSATISAMNPWVHPWMYQWFFAGS